MHGRDRRNKARKHILGLLNNSRLVLALLGLFLLVKNHRLPAFAQLLPQALARQRAALESRALRQWHTPCARRRSPSFTLDQDSLL